MKQLATAALLLIISIFSNAQKKPFTITNGPEIDGGRSYIHEVVGSGPTGTIICRIQKKNTFLEIVNDKGVVTKSVDLTDLKYKEFDKAYVGAFILNDQLFVRFSAREKREKILHTIIEKYDINTLSSIATVSEEEIDIEGMKSVYWYGIGVGRAISEAGENGFQVSSNEKYAIEYSSDFEKSKKTNENVSIKIFDSNMKILWSKEFEIPYPNNKFSIGKVIVDDFGNAHLLGREYLDDTRKRSGKPNYRTHIISFMDKGAAVKDNKLELDGSFITDINIGVTSDEKILVAGFYSSVSSFSINGAFSLKLDVKSQRIESTSKKEFDKEFIQEGMTEREVKKSNKKEAKGEDLEMPDFDLDELIVTPDGGWILLAEQFYITTRTYTTSGPNGTSTRTVTVYNYDDIIAIHMNAKGDILWNVKIPKHQASSGGTSMLSYAFGACDETLYIVYNTSPDQGNAVVASIIQPDGTVTRETAMTVDKGDLLFHPLYCDWISNCKMLLYSAKKKEYQFSIMKMNP